MTIHNKSSVRTDNYTRQPQHDRRIGRGDDFAGDAWLDMTTGAIIYVVVGVNPNETRGEEANHANQ